jgi:hypothetical protein
LKSGAVIIDHDGCPHLSRYQQIGLAQTHLTFCPRE